MYDLSLLDSSNGLPSLYNVEETPEETRTDVEFDNMNQDTESNTTTSSESAAAAAITNTEDSNATTHETRTVTPSNVRGNIPTRITTIANTEQRTPPAPAVPPSSNFGIFQISKVEDFISNSTSHAAVCQASLHLIERDTYHGAGIVEQWKCPRCNLVLELRNCDQVKTTVCEPGRNYAMPQPEVNIRLIRGARECGVNLLKLWTFVGGYLGIKFMAYRNILHIDRKWRQSVKDLFGVRMSQNLREHNAATRAIEGYDGDLEWEEDGETHCTCVGTASGDGAGATRWYNHRPRGSNSAYICESAVTKKPLAMVHSQVSSKLFVIILFSFSFA